MASANPAKPVGYREDAGNIQAHNTNDMKGGHYRKMKLHRLFALLLCIAMLLAFAAGCGNSTAEGEEQTETSAETTDPPVDSGEETVAPGEVFTNENGDLEYMLPLTEEQEVLTVWAPMTQEFQQYLDSYDQVESIQRLMEETNITLEFTSPASDQKNTQFMTMAASGDYMDLLDGVSTLYTAGLTGAYEEGVIIDLTDLQAESAPFYTAMVEELGVEKEVVDDEGRSYVFAMLQPDGVQLTTGLAARKDWMDELGMEKLETYDEWHEYLLGIKANHNATMWATQSGTLSYNFLSNGFGTQMFVFSNPGASEPYIVEDGVVNWGPLKEEAAVEYLTMMNQWYEEGLIYEDFLSVTTPFLADVTPMTNNSVGIAVITAGLFTSLTEAGLVDEGFELWPIQDAVKEEGMTYTTGTEVSVASLQGYSISTACENVDLAIKLCDYMYSKSGYYGLSYGVEGETYTLDENGSPHYTDFMVNNPDHTFAEQKNVIISIMSFRGAAGYAAEINEYSDAQKEALELWRKHSSENTYPASATMTADESSEHATLYSEVETYAATALTEFIIGTRDISEYDEFIQTCIDLGIEECIAIKQAAYDRYIAR